MGNWLSSVRFSYVPEARVKEVANTFREKKIPCDVIWFDINYMDEFRVFTINNRDFPDPKRMNKYLHDNGFHSVYMIDPGVKVDDNYFVYKTGKEQNAFVCDIYRNEFHGKVYWVLAHFLTLPVRRRALGGPDFIKTLWLME